MSKTEENKKPEAKELELDELEQVTGGSGDAFAGVPRVPEKQIDDSLRNKI